MDGYEIVPVAIDDGTPEGAIYWAAEYRQDGQVKGATRPTRLRSRACRDLIALQRGTYGEPELPDYIPSYRDAQRRFARAS